MKPLQGAVHLRYGNLPVDSDADVIVNTVNCVGVMGAGLALSFKHAFPEMFREYHRRCQRGQVVPGQMDVHELPEMRTLVNFPTKRHWKDKSRPGDIESGLVALYQLLVHRGARVVALSKLGCRNGGLDWNTQVGPMVQAHLHGPGRPWDIEIWDLR